MKQSFQVGVDTLYNKCVSCGSTPSSKTPTAISNSIQSIYTNRYNEGVSATKKGNAITANVLSGKTFTSTAGVNLTGTMPNRGNLNWSSSNTTYSVPVGYYSGGTLDSRPSYNAGYNAGQSSAAINTLLYCHGYNTSRISNGDPIPFDMSAYSGVVLICIACIWAWGVALEEDTINLSPTPSLWVHKPSSENDHTGIGGSWGYCATLVAKYNLDSVSGKTVYLTHGSNEQMRGCGWFVFRSV